MSAHTPEVLTQALNKAKIALMSRKDSAFFTTICFSLRFQWDEKCPTAYTNGKLIGCNPDFFMNLDPEERVFVLLHETLHAAYLHMVRRGSREHQRWNIAADHVINLQLKARGYKMPSFGLADDQYRDLNVEKVYDLIPEAETCPMPDLMESVEPPPEMEEHMREILVRASIQSRMAGDAPGTIPGDIQIYLDKLLDPKLPWQRILQKYMHAMAKADYTFRRPNRRFFPQHHLPSLYSEALMSIAIAVDTSGSVGDIEFTHFISEISHILRRVQPEKITLIQFDTKLKSVDELRSVQDLTQVIFTGRGGTRIAPVLEWAAENKPQLLLVFTDGEFHFHNATSKTPIVWLIHNNQRFHAPFGKTVNYELEC